LSLTALLAWFSWPVGQRQPNPSLSLGAATGEEKVRRFPDSESVTRVELKVNTRTVWKPVWKGNNPEPEILVPAQVSDSSIYKLVPESTNEPRWILYHDGRLPSFGQVQDIADSKAVDQLVRALCSLTFSGQSPDPRSPELGLNPPLYEVTLVLRGGTPSVEHLLVKNSASEAEGRQKEIKIEIGLPTDKGLERFALVNGNLLKIPSSVVGWINEVLPSARSLQFDPRDVVSLDVGGWENTANLRIDRKENGWTCKDFHVKVESVNSFLDVLNEIGGKERQPSARSSFPISLVGRRELRKTMFKATLTIKKGSAISLLSVAQEEDLIEQIAKPAPPFAHSIPHFGSGLIITITPPGCPVSISRTLNPWSRSQLAFVDEVHGRAETKLSTDALERTEK
jgi:hypothetical protein